MLTKKRVLWGSLIGSLCTILIDVIQKYFDWSFGTDCEFYNPPFFDCASALLGFFFIIFIPILIFSLVTYRMKEGIFLLWKKFTFIYLFIYLFIVTIAPWGYDDFFPIAKEIMVMVFGSIYLLISLILIAYKYFALRKKG